MSQTGAGTKKCIKCGRELPEGASFCPYCESSQLEVKSPAMPKIRRRWSFFALAACVVIIAAAAVMLPGLPFAKSLQPAPAGETASPAAEPSAADAATGPAAALAEPSEAAGQPALSDPEPSSQTSGPAIEPAEEPVNSAPAEEPAETAEPEPETRIPEDEPEANEPEPLLQEHEAPAQTASASEPSAAATPSESSATPSTGAGSTAPLQGSAELTWADPYLSDGHYTAREGSADRNRSLANGEKLMAAFLYDGKLVEDGTLTASGDLRLERIDRGVYWISMNGWNGGSVTYTSGSAVSTLPVKARLPEIGAYSSPSSSMSGLISSFTITESSNVFYIVFSDNNETGHRTNTRIWVAQEYYAPYFTIEPMTEGVVYKVTVDPEFNKASYDSRVISFFAEFNDAPFGTRQTKYNIWIANIYSFTEH